ncbi:MAG: hypothetical protein UH239_06975 [Acutalibacteraceae bacterium]|nr:hypothetical protein [Acutalibacteraceae bacterium]
MDYQLANEIGTDCILPYTEHQSRKDLLTIKKTIIDKLKDLKKYLF